MGNCSTALDTVDESRWRFPTPVVERFLCRKTIKRAINFYGGKFRDVELQVSVRRKIRRIKVLCPALIDPTACADVNAASFH